MARNYTTNTTINLAVNAKQASQMMDTLKNKTEELNKKLASTSDALTQSRLKAEIKENERLMELFKAQTTQVAEVLANLDKSSLKELNRTMKHLRAQLSGMKKDSEGWEEQIEKIQKVQEAINAIKEDINDSMSLGERFKNFIEKQVTGLTTFFGWILGVKEKLEEFVKDYTEMQQEMANVQKFTGMTEEQVSELNAAFKNLDTRTSREELNKLAQEAGRLGKSSVEDVLGFVRAADKINVALDDLGEGATLTLSKLTGIFGDEERLGTEKALLSVGSVVNELSQNCSASASYLTDFASRMGGVGAQAGMTVQQIMAFASVLDSNNQALEVSATAMSQLLVKLYQDTSNYARVAGLDAKEFSSLLKKDANEALITFLEAIGKAGKMDVLSLMFKDMGEKGSGMVSTLSTLASNIGMVRSQQLAANEAFEEAISIDQEFEVQNNTVLAGYEKSEKALKEITIELGERLSPVLSLCYSSLTLLLNMMSQVVQFIFRNKTEIAILTGYITAYTVVLNLAAIKTNVLTAAHTLWNKAVLLSNKILPVFRPIIAGVTNAVQYFTNGLRVNYAMQERWRNAMKAMSLTNWAGLFLTLATAIALVGKKMYDAAKRQKELREERARFAKESTDYSRQAEGYYSKEISSLRRLYDAAMDEKKAKEERISAAQRLISMYPQQFANMSTEEIMLGKAKTAYDNLTKSIINNAKAKAAAEKVLENEKKILDLELEVDQEREKKREASEKRDKTREYNKIINQKASESASSLTGAIAMGAGGSQTVYEQKSTRDEDKKIFDASRQIKEKNEQIKVLQEANDKLTARYEGNSVFKESLDVKVETAPADPEYTGYTKTESDKERKKREKAEAAAARAAAAKERKEFKEALRAIKGQRDADEAEAKVLRMTGQADYRQYFELLREAELDYYMSAKKLYEQHNLQEDADYKALLEKELDNERKYNEQRLVLRKEASERIAKVEEQQFRAKYAMISNPTLAVQLRLQEDILITRFSKLVEIQQMYDRGSKEWEDYEFEIQQLLAEDKLEKQKMLVAKAAAFQKEFDLLTVEQRYEVELAALKKLYEQEMISEEQYQRWLAGLERKKAKEKKEQKDSLPGKAKEDSPAARQRKAQDDFNEGKKKLDDALAAGIIDESEYSEKLRRLRAELNQALIAPLKDANSEWVSLMTSMAEAWMNFADLLKEGAGIDELIGGMGVALSSAVAMMSAVMSTVTEFTKAQTEIQVKSIEKRYDRELSFAEGNAYMTKKLEKEKQQEIAKIKEDAANKEFAMQVIAAIAQTATNALNAYGSAAAIPVVGHVLAPIAAGIAVAQGMVQVALIRKQKEAAAATGYSSGGFTKPGRVDEPAGVVHAGEWVASQKLVQSPVARPIIDMLEYAQRTNRLSSLSMEDVSRSVAAPMMLAYGRSAEQNGKPGSGRLPASGSTFNIQQSTLDSGSSSALSSSLERLNRRLDEPFLTVNTVAGPLGSEQAKQRYERLMRNKNPKKRS